MDAAVSEATRFAPPGDPWPEKKGNLFCRSAFENKLQGGIQFRVSSSVFSGHHRHRVLVEGCCLIIKTPFQAVG